MSEVVVEQRRGVVGWVVRHPIIVISLVLIALAACTCLFLDLTAKDRFARRIAAIRAKGEPVSVDDLRGIERLTPDDENMTPALLRAFAPYQKFEVPPEKNRLLPFVGIAEPLLPGQAATAEQMEAARWYLAQYPESLGRIHEALKRRKGQFVYPWQTPLFEMQVPELSSLRGISKTLALQALVSCEAGDEASVKTALIDLHRCVHALDNEYHTAIGVLVRIALLGVAEEATVRAINRCGLSGETLADVQRAHSSSLGIAKLRNMQLVERVSFLDLMEWLETTGQATRHANLSPSTNWLPWVRRREVGRAIDAFTKLVAKAGLAESEVLERRYELDEVEVDESDEEDSVYMIPVYSLHRAIQLGIRSAAMARAFQAAVACEQFRIAHGRWPAKLDEVVPEFLVAVPVDPFDGKPIRFAVIPEGIKTWTIGEDLKDDGGNVMRLEKVTSKKQPTDFGWVILNLERRGMKSTDAGE